MYARGPIDVDGHVILQGGTLRGLCNQDKRIVKRKDTAIEGIQACCLHMFACCMQVVKATSW